jgi:predicted nucleic acid-binding protein
MNGVFGDASFFVALISRRDSHHDLADRLGEKYRGRILTTQWVLVEVANFFADSKRRATAIEFIEALLGDPDTEIVRATFPAFQDGWTLYRARADQSWSLTDCISFNLMRERGITEALTSDHHFEQAGFRILLK